MESVLSEMWVIERRGAELEAVVEDVDEGAEVELEVVDVEWILEVK